MYPTDWFLHVLDRTFRVSGDKLQVRSCYSCRTKGQSQALNPRDAAHAIALATQPPLAPYVDELDQYLPRPLRHITLSSGLKLLSGF